MKAIKVDVFGAMSVIEIEAPVYQSVGKLLNSLIEHVKPRRLLEPYCMLVDEEGLLKNLPMNLVGSWLYATELHGNPIVGDIYIMRDEAGADGCDIAGLTAIDVPILLADLKTVVTRITRGWEQ